jgi:hypothetical protein
MSSYISTVSNSLPSIRNMLLGEPDQSGVHNPTVANQLLLTLVVVVVCLLVYKLIEMIAQRISSNEKDRPYLVPATKDAKREVTIYQNPLGQNSGSDQQISLRRSLNETGGLEFTYSWWMFIESYEYKNGAWKHVFHKGNNTSWPNRGPGVWLHPTENSMYFYMNSYRDIQNEVSVSNIPIGKWFHCTLSVTQNHVNIYINGFLKERKTLNGIAKQNFGDVYINSFGGFDGYMSRMRYYDYATTLSEIRIDVVKGPNMELPYASQQKPPYLTPYWWVNDYS